MQFTALITRSQYTQVSPFLCHSPCRRSPTNLSLIGFSTAGYFLHKAIKVFHSKLVFFPSCTSFLWGWKWVLNFDCSVWHSIHPGGSSCTTIRFLASTCTPQGSGLYFFALSTCSVHMGHTLHSADCWVAPKHLFALSLLKIVCKLAAMWWWRWIARETHGMASLLV